MQNSFVRKVDQQYALLQNCLSTSRSEPDSTALQAAWLQLELALDCWAGELIFRAEGNCYVAPRFFEWLTVVEPEHYDKKSLQEISMEGSWLGQIQQGSKALRSVDKVGSIKGSFFSTEDSQTHKIPSFNADATPAWQDKNLLQVLIKDFYETVCRLRVAADEF